MSVLVLSLFAVAGAAHDEQAKPNTLSTEFVIKAPTEELARAVLPPEIAVKVKGHELTPPFHHWIEGYGARFWGEATIIEPGFCKRETYYLSMSQRTKGELTPYERITPNAQIKMAADCATATEPFIHLNSTSPQEAVELLRWFKNVHRAAGGDSELKVEVECRSEQDPNPCEKGARQVLAELPLESVFIIERLGRRAQEEDWRISIRPTIAPSLYWQLSIFNWSTDRPRVRISWDTIPPF